VKLWIDEDLSPTLVAVCHEAGYQATSVRDRGKLSTKDHALAKIVLDEGWVLVTNNAGDFLKLAAIAGVHPGLMFIELGSAQQERDWLAAGIAYIESRALAAKDSTEGLMVNRVVEVDEKGGCSDYEWP
jgi:predicted nuclease of predicted toxin-antitoxin system